MIKTLTTIGNSKAIIIPSEMIKKYALDKVIIEETEDGILLRSAQSPSAFQKKVEKLWKDKAHVYKKIESEANDTNTINYYAKDSNLISDVDLNIIEK